MENLKKFAKTKPRENFTRHEMTRTTRQEELFPFRAENKFETHPQNGNLGPSVFPTIPPPVTKFNGDRSDTPLNDLLFHWFTVCFILLASVSPSLSVTLPTYIKL